MYSTVISKLVMESMKFKLFITVVIFCLLTSLAFVQSDFILTVKFVNYTNPTGLCAECRNRAENVTSATQLVPVCCDELPFRTDNCSNTGEARCDTRFRWAIRPFGASLETRPNNGYFFTPCPQSPTTCPFSEMSTTFGQGNSSFLGVAANPLPVSSREAVLRGQPALVPWTGRIQFFIEAVDSQLPNIIDSLLVNLDNLQLGAAFSEEMTFSGFHNISHMTMSFRVECAPGFCGDDCLSTLASNRWIAGCQANGNFICINSRLNPLPSTPTSPGCSSCLHNLGISTDCTTCLEANFDPATNCTACFPGYDITSNCTSCLTNRDISTSCTQCLPGWDITSDCTSCLPRRDPATNCSLCLQPDQFTDTECTVCTTPGGDPTIFCETCLPNFNQATNCTECVGNHDLTTNCSSCLSGYDNSTGCRDCLPGRDIASSCATCLSGFTGENCEPNVGDSIGGSVIGGIAGGVGGALLIILILLTMILFLAICLKRKSNSNRSADKESVVMSRNPKYRTGTLEHTADNEAIELQPNTVYGMRSEVNHTPQYESVEPIIAMEQNPVYTVTTATAQSDAIQLQPNVVYGVGAGDDQTDYYENEGLVPPASEQTQEYDYVQV